MYYQQPEARQNVGYMQDLYVEEQQLRMGQRSMQYDPYMQQQAMGMGGRSQRGMGGVMMDERMMMGDRMILGGRRGRRGEMGLIGRRHGRW